MEGRYSVPSSCSEHGRDPSHGRALCSRQELQWSEDGWNEGRTYGAHQPTRTRKEMLTEVPSVHFLWDQGTQKREAFPSM